MLRHSWIFGAVGLLAVASAGADETGSIGSVDELINIAYRQPVDQPRVQVQLADQLYQNETLETEPDAAMLVTFLDGTTLRLEGGSKVVLDQYVFNPATADGAAVMSFGAGVFRFVTGGIEQEDVQLETAAATIGIRGTVLNIVVTAGGATVVDVLDGAIVVRPNCVDSELGAKVGQRATITSCSDPGSVTAIPGTSPQAQDAQALNDIEPAAEPEPEPEPADNHSGQGDGSNPGDPDGNNGGQANPNNSNHDKNEE